MGAEQRDMANGFGIGRDGGQCRNA